jgi:uncharacterized SAM-binding protein YcdF (DUF218 family)
MSLTVRVLIVLVILMVSWVFLAPFLANRLIVEKPLKKADVILVLSGSKVFKERATKAAAEYKKSVADKVLLTDDGGYAGWSQEEQKNPKFVDLAKRELIAQGVAAEDIEILKPEVTGTIYEAQNLAKAIKENDWRSALIVTSPYHTRRSLDTFTKIINDQNFTVGIVSTPFGNQTPLARTWWLSGHGWDLVGGEYVKSLYYWVYY